MTQNQTTDYRLLWELRTADLDKANADVACLQAEVASLRLTLGGRTFYATVPEPIGCPCPGACSTVAEIGRLRVAIRVNALRHGATDAEIDDVIYGRR